MNGDTPVHAMISVIPIGVGTSLSRYIAACERVFQEAGLKAQLHAHGTNLEGPWDKVFDAVRKAVTRVHEMGAPRVSTLIKLSTRTDKHPTMEAMVASVESKLREGDL